jgi:hypothetical protein
MSGDDNFYFVEESPGEGSSSRSGSRMSRETRSFVMRRTRLQQQWSTRSNRSEDRRRSRGQQRSEQDPAMSVDSYTTQPPSSLEPLREDFQTDPGPAVPFDHTGMLPYMNWDGIPLCLLCGLPRSTTGVLQEGACCCEESAQPLTTNPGGGMDPFNTFAMPLVGSNDELASYCL